MIQAEIRFSYATLTTIMLCVAMITSSCSSAGSGTGTKNTAGPIQSQQSLIEDGSWLLKVDRVWNGQTVISLPNDTILDDDYLTTDLGNCYKIIISEHGSKLAIQGTPVSGVRILNTENRCEYQIEDGLFSGGVIYIWNSSFGIQAEYRVYGSGKPVVGSERGVFVNESQLREFTGTVRYDDLEGGYYGIRVNGGEWLDPINLPVCMEIEGVEVCGKYFVPENTASIHMSGEVVYIIEIEVVSDLQDAGDVIAHEVAN